MPQAKMTAKSVWKKCCRPHPTLHPPLPCPDRSFAKSLKFKNTSSAYLILPRAREDGAGHLTHADDLALHSPAWVSSSIHAYAYSNHRRNSKGAVEKLHTRISIKPLAAFLPGRIISSGRETASQQWNAVEQGRWRTYHGSDSQMEYRLPSQNVKKS